MGVTDVTREGRDATNDLTYLLMDAVRHVRIYQPSLATRVHNKSPEKYLRKIVDVIRSGMGFPAVHFGYWSELLQEWAEQGKISKDLAGSVGDGNDADRELDRIIGWGGSERGSQGRDEGEEGVYGY